ncbi:MAG: arginine--tRNA ligase [Chitinophagales bacterium]|nr:arginine--tRNA ligase [Chitinophagales bacterium]
MLEKRLRELTARWLAQDFGAKIEETSITVNHTKKEHEGDVTIVVFPLTRYTGKSPEETARLLGEKLKSDADIVATYHVVKGFLNLTLTASYWLNELQKIAANTSYGMLPSNGQRVVLEYCGPNTNKPLHIGHVRNMLLGYAMGEILKAVGYEVIKVNIYNDRGIAICKSMVAYRRFANGATPQSVGVKGDHFVGDWYVKFNEAVNEELQNISDKPDDKDEAAKLTPIYREAQEMVKKWEAGDPETLALWKQMNEWVYEGFRETYRMLGVDFQKDYYESETYKLGKDIIEEGLQKGIFKKRADGAVVIDLTEEGLDEKVLLRSDGTSIYITQDLGTAELRYREFNMDKMIYVVANEQDYHFKVLKLCLQKLGRAWADGIYHLSYALVESPTGRFKSREGKTADADDLIAEVLRLAEEKTRELGKIEGLTDEQLAELYRIIGLGALKYFILRVNPYKKIIFNPEESIDLHGHTGPFIQYTHARICAVLRKADENDEVPGVFCDDLKPEERELIIHLTNYENTLRNAAATYDPSELANYLYQLAKLYNKFYHDWPILNAATEPERALRLLITQQTGRIIRQGMKLLGMEVPERM